VNIRVLANKVCPVILRRVGSVIQVLAFEHPLAGCQLVKGTIEAGEPIEMAALRELAEESGIASAVVARSLGTWSSAFEEQIWAFVECRAIQTLPESCVHEAPDDGGHSFRFFWHPLFETASPDHWHPVFRGALRFIQMRPDPLHEPVG
jgi:8-oxo-dGTP pyrophosphatase MutT (NUDIX family)